jgi:hypothetical protein
MTMPGGYVIAYYQEYGERIAFTTMNESKRRMLFWTPRLLSILFAIFISLFALDVFGEGYGFW